MRRFSLIATLCLGLGLPAQAPAQSAVGWLDLFTPDRLVQQMVQFGIMSLRTQLDLKYGDMSVDLRTGRVTLTDVRLWPLPPWDEAGDCMVSIDRMTVRSGALDQIDRLRLKAQVSGAEVALACLPPDARGAAAMAGLEQLDVSRLTLDADYGVPGSNAVSRLFAVVDNVAAVDLTARLAYVWFDGREDMEEPDPVVFLESARLSVENRGIWEAMKGQLPPPLLDPDGAPLFIEGAIGSALADLNRSASGGGTEGDPSALSDAQRAFVDSAAAAWPAFLADPDTLVLETALSEDVYLDFNAFEDDPRAVFETLKPRLALTSGKVSSLLPTALLRQAMGPDAGALSEEDRRKVGLALISGDGAPRDIEKGFALLNPLAKAGDGAAALALSAALEVRAPEDAYLWALAAGADGETGATARLDRLESRFDLATVLRLQNEVSGRASHPSEALQSLAALREQAAKRLSGRGLARSYPIAAMWAMLGKALGDAESADILAAIDEHVRLSGDGAQEAWRPAEQRASDLALEAWLSGDLPGRFAP